MIRMRLWTPISCLIFRTKLQWMDSNSKSFLSSWFDLLRMYQYSVYCVSYYCCCSQLVERWVSLLSRLVAEQLYRTVSDVQGYPRLSVLFQLNITYRKIGLKSNVQHDQYLIPSLAGGLKWLFNAKISRSQYHDKSFKFQFKIINFNLF